MVLFTLYGRVANIQIFSVPCFPSPGSGWDCILGTPCGHGGDAAAYVGVQITCELPYLQLRWQGESGLPCPSLSLLFLFGRVLRGLLISTYSLDSSLLPVALYLWPTCPYSHINKNTHSGTTNQCSSWIHSPLTKSSWRVKRGCLNPETCVIKFTFQLLLHLLLSSLFLIRTLRWMKKKSLEFN